ncbi:MAG: ABC transporter permease, partial [Planctomycetes bacterium]|nr:ABC transporter permease [Planctomycetota bacterium]
GREDKVTVSDDPVSETGGRYIDFLVPGLLGMGLMGGGMWGVGFSIVNLRIRKLLKRYLATPMKRSHFLIAMMISRVLFTIPEMLVLVWGAHWLFGVENQGSFLAVVVLVFLGAFEFSGIGLLIASRAETTETVSGLMNLVMLPMWIGSGVFYSVDRFPASVQLVLNQLPLTPLIHGLRGVMQDGASLAVLFPQLMVISLWGLITFGLALWWFRWQ